MHSKLLAAILAAATFAGSAFAAQAADAIRIGYQTNVDPAKVEQADGVYDKAFGRAPTGASSIWARGHRRARLRQYRHRSRRLEPARRGRARGAPIEAFLVAGLIGEAEALVVRNGAGIAKPEDLVGKNVAVPFVSTTHYSLLSALKHWGIDPAKVNILNLRPPEIAAAFSRGDIDATYVWDPALGAAQARPARCSSPRRGRRGRADLRRLDRAQGLRREPPADVTAFTKVTLDAYAEVPQGSCRLGRRHGQCEKIAGFNGSKADEIAEQLANYGFPTLTAGPILGKGTAKAIKATSAFLRTRRRSPTCCRTIAPRPRLTSSAGRCDQLIAR